MTSGLLGECIVIANSKRDESSRRAQRFSAPPLTNRPTPRHAPRHHCPPSR
jgi:hypothetical protein